MEIDCAPKTRHELGSDHERESMETARRDEKRNSRMGRDTDSGSEEFQEINDDAVKCLLDCNANSDAPDLDTCVQGCLAVHNKQN